MGQGLVVLSLGVSVVGTVAAQEESAVSAKQLERAREVFRLGVGLLQQEPVDYLGAYSHFEKAYELSRSWKVLGNLGLCAFHLEKYDEALKFYAEYLSKGESQVSEQEAASVRAETRSILETSGSVSLVGIDQKLKIVVTRVGAKLPPQSYELAPGEVIETRLKQGLHQFVASNSSGEKSQLELRVVAEESVAARFEFSAPSAEEKQLPAPAIAEDQSGWSTTQSVGVGVLSVAAAELVVAMGVGFLAVGRERSAQAKCDELTSECKPEAKADFDAHANYIRAVNVLLIAGGVTALTGAGLVVFGASEGAPTQARLSLSPFWTGATGGIAARGTF